VPSSFNNGSAVDPGLEAAIDQEKRSQKGQNIVFGGENREKENQAFEKRPANGNRREALTGCRKIVFHPV
jgi:hypothetical protein